MRITSRFEKINSRGKNKYVKKVIQLEIIQLVEFRKIVPRYIDFYLNILFFYS